MNAVLFLGSASSDRCQKKQNKNASGKEVSSLGGLKLPLSIFIVKVYISWDHFGEFGSLKNLGSGEISWIPTSLSAQEGESLGVRHHEKQHILKPVPNEGCEAVVEKLRQNAKKKYVTIKKKKKKLLG